MKKFWKRLPKWGKILVWVLAGIVGLILLFVLGFKIWTLTWKTYTDDEFGFSFRYPASWHVLGAIPSKVDFDKGNYPHGDFVGVIFNIDPNVSVLTENLYTPSAGDVEVSFYKRVSETLGDRPVKCSPIKKAETEYSCEDYSFPFVILRMETKLYVFELWTAYTSANLPRFGVRSLFTYWTSSQIINSFSFNK